MLNIFITSSTIRYDTTPGKLNKTGPVRTSGERGPFRKFTIKSALKSAIDTEIRKWVLRGQTVLEGTSWPHKFAPGVASQSTGFCYTTPRPNFIFAREHVKKRNGAITRPFGPIINLTNVKMVQ